MNKKYIIVTMGKIATLIFVFLKFTAVFAQPVIHWQKSLGGSSVEYSETIVQTNDGGFVVSGNSVSNDGDVSGNHGNADAWVVKLDSVGNIIWQKCLGGSGWDGFLSVVALNDGGLVFTGATTSNNGDVSGNHGSLDGWVVKLDSVGNIIWQKCLGGSSEDVMHHILLSSDSGFVVCGSTMSNNGDVSGNHGGHDAWVVKLDSVGNIIWQKCLGGSSEDVARDIIKTNDGGFLVGGQTESNDGDVSGNHGDADAWVVKLDSVGNIIWQKCLGGSGFDVIQSLGQCSNSWYFLLSCSNSNDGDVSGNHGGFDFWVSIIDNSGVLLNQKCFGGTGEDYAFSIIQTLTNNFYLSGRTFSNDGDVSGNHGNYDYWVLSIDSTLLLQWQKCLGGSDFDTGEEIIETFDGNILMHGRSASNDGDVTGNHGSTDFWVIKLILNSTNLIEDIPNSKTMCIYPNPSSDIFTVQLLENGTEVPSKVELRDNNGKVIERRVLYSKDDIIFSTSHLAPAIYSVKVTFESGEAVERILNVVR